MSFLQLINLSSDANASTQNAGNEANAVSMCSYLIVTSRLNVARCMNLLGMMVL